MPTEPLATAQPAWLGDLSDVAEVRGRAGMARVAPGTVAERAGALRRAGVTHLLFELHGPSAEAHQQVDGEPFEAILAAIDHARAHDLHAVVVSDASRSGMRVLRETGALLARLGVRLWCIRMPWSPPELPPPQLPRAALALPFVLDAAVRARASGMETILLGAPLCLLGPHHPLALPGAGADGAPCDGCAARSRCAGLGPGYRALFGAGELRPIAAPPESAPSPLARALAEALRGS